MSKRFGYQPVTHVPLEPLLTVSAGGTNAKSGWGGHRSPNASTPHHIDQFLGGDRFIADWQHR
jgi:hypothetical protein